METPRSSAPDAGALLARAEGAFATGRFADARVNLHAAQQLVGDHLAILHLLALVEKRLGNQTAAAEVFRRALSLAPSDPQLHSNYANLLDSVGDAAGAMEHYDRALAAAPRFADARLNRALLLNRLGRPAEALADIDVAAAEATPGARLLTARGGVLQALERLDEAAAAFDAALTLEPARLVALAGRARIAMERGEVDAVDRYHRALSIRPNDPKLQLGLALATEAAGGAVAIPLLEKLVQRWPEWVEGHEQLSRMRSEAGTAEDNAGSYRAAIAASPANATLQHSYWNTLIRAERFHDALVAIAQARAHLPVEPSMLLVEAIAASEAGDRARADATFARLPATGAAALPLARHRLRSGEPEQAARLLEPLVAQDPDDVAAWAYLSLAWRLLGDGRAAWLCEQVGLVGVMDLEYSPSELGDLAALLRSMHHARAHPTGQSLRGGTQTRGRLLARREPLLVDLRRRLEAAVAAHVKMLPPADLRHPLLRHRTSSFALAGSWSVRLGSSGFHVHHIHPQGVLSSAFYVAVPRSVGDYGTRDGWLELGAPPHELGIGLPALSTVEPRPGRLVLFPSYLFHGTRPFPAGERLTVAFDVQVR